MIIKSNDLLGKNVLIGFTFFNKAGELMRKEQHFGRVVEVNEDCILVQEEDGNNIALPPYLSGFESASPGTYRCRETDLVVVDPDYTSSWDITLPD